VPATNNATERTMAAAHPQPQRARLQDLVRFGQRLHPLQFIHRLDVRLTWDRAVPVAFPNLPTVYVPLCNSGRRHIDGGFRKKDKTLYNLSSQQQKKRGLSHGHCHPFFSRGQYARKRRAAQGLSQLWERPSSGLGNRVQALTRSPARRSARAPLPLLRLPLHVSALSGGCAPSRPESAAPAVGDHLLGIRPQHPHGQGHPRRLWHPALPHDCLARRPGVVDSWSVPAPPQGVRVLGVDGFYASIKGKDSGMVVAVEMGTGHPVALARIDEKDRPALFAWLETLKEALGVEVLVSDDFNSYTSAAERLELEHQICRFHYLRWVNRLLSQLQKKLDDQWDGLLDEVRLLIQELPPDVADADSSNSIGRSRPHLGSTISPCTPWPVCRNCCCVSAITGAPTACALSRATCRPRNGPSAAGVFAVAACAASRPGQAWSTLHPLQFIHRLGVRLTWDRAVPVAFPNSPTVYVPLCNSEQT
jgi:hypothetical protein